MVAVRSVATKAPEVADYAVEERVSNCCKAVVQEAGRGPDGIQHVAAVGEGIQGPWHIRSAATASQRGRVREAACVMTFSPGWNQHGGCSLQASAGHRPLPATAAAVLV